MKEQRSCIRVKVNDEIGEIASWVLVLLMSAALVVVIWSVAQERLVAIVRSALSSVCGSIGC